MIEQVYALNNQTGCEYRRSSIETDSIGANSTYHEAICNSYYHLQKYCLIVVVIIGLVGNLLTIVVFTRSKFSFFNRAKFYLICLAFSDIVYLIALFFVWLDNIELSNIMNYDYICQLSVYLTYISSFMSTQLVVAFTSQRFFSISFPLKVNLIEKKSRQILITLIFFACVFYNFSLWSYKPECPLRDQVYSHDEAVPRCKAKRGLENLVDEFDLVDSAFTFILPFNGILIMNIIIIRKLKESNHNFTTRTNNNLAEHDLAVADNKKLLQKPAVLVFRDQNEKSNNNNNNSNHLLLTNTVKDANSGYSSNCSSSSKSKQPRKSMIIHSFNSRTTVSNKVTKMFIWVSTVFLLLNLPYHSFKLYAYIRIRVTNEHGYTYTENCVINFSQQLFYASFSCNFFLYSFTGVAFRNEFKKLIKSFLKFNTRAA